METVYRMRAWKSKRKVKKGTAGGGINRDYPDDIWSQVQCPEILPGANQGMKCLKEKWYESL